MNNQFTYPKEKIRFAILTFFFAQGLCMASWASRIPDFKDVFAANYAFYWGLILFMIPVGKFVAIPLAGYLVSKLGSRTMVQVSILGYAMSLLCVGLAHEVYLLGFLLFCFGVFWNLCDISFNTQGIEVERLYGKDNHGNFSWRMELGSLYRSTYRLRDDSDGHLSCLALYADSRYYPYHSTGRTKISARNNASYMRTSEAGL